MYAPLGKTLGKIHMGYLGDLDHDNRVVASVTQYPVVM